MKFAALILVTLTLPIPTLADDGPKPAEGGWIQLFNGKDIKDWRVKIRNHDLDDNFANTFRVEDGILQVRYDGYGDHFQERFGHLHYKTPFSHYRLRVEYRFVGEQCAGGPTWAIRNSGVMLHGESPELMHKDQNFPASIEVQLLGGAGKKDRSTMNLCTPGTHVVMGGKLLTRHCFDSQSKTYHGDQWVTAEIEVRGNQSIKHVIDGKTVLEYTAPQLGGGSVSPDGHVEMLIKKNGGNTLQGGYISLQSESHPVDFRKVEIMHLKAKDAK